tara:strand:- start:908 stop:1852 length:945 start_codon:yes stop_codon:yes gene_type:complete
MLNFLYCVDQNYNKQLETSIFSLLEGVKEKIKIYVIHKDPNSLKVSKKVLNHNNLNKLIIVKFMQPGIKFPNLENTHVSEATYYRLFLQDYIPKDEGFILYMDADIVCINNPTSVIKREIEKLSISKNIISVKSEKIFEEYLNETLQRLKLTQNNYFNAGVMLINLSKWFDENLSIKLIEHMESIENDIKYWDQDVLNSYFDGKFTELSEYLNFKLLLNYENLHTDLVQKKGSVIKFIHYTGKYKPWAVKGALNVNTFYYHEYYSQLFNSTYHIKDSRKMNSLRELSYALFKGSFFKSKYPIKLLLEIVKSFFK